MLIEVELLKKYFVYNCIQFLFSANVLAMKHKRKTLTAHDVLDAMDEMEFESFIEPLKEGLEGKQYSHSFYLNHEVYVLKHFFVNR